MAINTNIGPERVQVLDKPLGVVQVPGASTSVTGFLISTSQAGAPENQPVRIRSLEEFEASFGGPDEVAHDAYYAVQGYYDNAGVGATAIIVNVGTSPSAADWIGSAVDSSGLRALDAQDDLGLVCIPGLPLETAFLVHPALIDYTETVRAEFGATLSTSFSLLSIPRDISKSNAEEVVHTTKFISEAGSGPWVLTVEDVLASAAADLSDVKPGMILTDATDSFRSVIVAVDDTADTITVATNPSFTAGDDLLIKMPSAVSYKELVVNNPSRTAAWYFNNTVVVDRASTPGPSGTVVVDPVGHVAGAMARIDANTAIGGVSHAPAGIKFAGLAGILGLSLALSERLDGEPLRLNFINRLTSFPGAGNVIFGGYTADSGTSPTLTADEQLIQVMRSLQFIKRSLESGLRSFLWENFSPETQSQVERAIESFLRNNIYLFPAGLPEAQQFRVLRVEATQNDLDLGVLKVRVLVKPNKAVRFIEVALEYPLPTA
jgi:phage tail sheath protein FI